MADDGAADALGKPVLKSISHEGNAVPIPGYVSEAEHAFIAQMKFYVPAQEANGATTLIDYFDADGATRYSESYAKPLIGAYIYGPVETVEGLGFVGHGKRDAYASVSLDDGLTWKNTNLSESASETSCDGSAGGGGCNVVRTDVPLFADTEGAYPGDVINTFHAIAGNRVLVAWPSRFCSSGQPNYSLDTEEPTPEQAARRAAIAAYMGINLATASKDDLFLVDMFGVGGQQGFVDYAEDKFEQNWPVGQVPFSCLWTARGVLVQGNDPRTAAAEASYMRWFKAERLTSGRRDVNRIETICVAGAGCAITWQEDPDGLRPGQGEGPGEGWSGAIANSQTDVWYSYIPWDKFDVVQDPAVESGATPMTFAQYTAAAAGDITQKPKPFVPFAMPMRLTDNAKCNVTNPQPYCNGSAIARTDVLNPLAYGLKDMCAHIIQIPTGQAGTPSDICVSADGLANVGNTAATRPRLGMYGYASSGILTDPADSAFAVVVTEEDKGLGKFTFEDGTIPCEPTANNDPECVAFDEGKNIWYHTFSMKLTDTVGGKTADGLVANLTSHGSMLNQPEVDWETGNFYPVVNTSLLWNFGTYNHDIYNTEIARRGSLLAQDIYKVTGTTKAKGRLIALPTWKQGGMNQGGPADVMSRRILIPTGWKLAVNGNPYAFRNMACSKWAYKTVANPYYPEGLCLDSALNLSATIPDICQDSATGETVACPQVDFTKSSLYGIGDTNPILQGVVQGEGNTTKVLSWHQCQSPADSYKDIDGTVKSCANDQRIDVGALKVGNTLRDQSWYNPLDVAKGHRGFLDGDFVMMLYAWSPNWRLNAKGNDRYELYIRRSFNGGLTWTTLPASYTHWDASTHTGAGTVTCETFRSDETQAGGDLVEPGVCNTYLAGRNEQARNVTQHKAMKITTLDPRFAISGSPQGVSNTADPFGTGITNPRGDDVRNPSRYFIVYETGDNKTTVEGEPEPLDLFYSRAVKFGDHYQVWAELSDLSQCYPSNPHDNEVPAHVVGTGFCNEFDQLEQGKPGLEASEASLTASPGGQFLYGVWAQLEHPVENNETQWDEVLSSDAMARRVWWLEGYIPSNAWEFGQGAGDGEPANP
ncbi:MAG TPA: choice-of-anchor O protein [Thiobacillus sp.]|nr:choice-of-anchor O protein [Thiobacillus sp.]